VPPGYEGVARSDDGLTWQRAKNAPALAVQDPDSAVWTLSLKESLRKASDAKRDYARRKMAFVICRPLD